MPAPALLSEPAIVNATATFSGEPCALDDGRSAFACAFTCVCGAPGSRAYHLRAIAATPDSFDRAAFHCFLAKSFFLRRLGLFVNVRMPAVVVPFEIRRRGFAAQIAINALIIDIEFAGYVLGVFVRDIGHGFLPKKVKWNVRKKRSGCKAFCALT